MSELQHTAYHEAGHAVAYWHFGKGIEHVTVVPDEEQGSAGHIHAKKTDSGEREHSSFDAMVRELCELSDSKEREPEQTLGELPLEEIIGEPIEWALEQRDMICTLAGEVTTFILEGKKDPVGAGRSRDVTSGDTKQVFDYLYGSLSSGDAAVDDAQVGHYYDFLWCVTLRVMKHRWAAVEAVAKALIEKKTLSGDECEEVIRDAIIPPQLRGVGGDLLDDSSETTTDGSS